MPSGIEGVNELAIRALSESASGSQKQSAGGAREASQTFGRLLARAVDDLNTVNNEANEAAAKLAAGQPVELHDVMIAMEQADLSLRMVLQVRNKLVEAYQEIQRMQV